MIPIAVLRISCRGIAVAATSAIAAAVVVSATAGTVLIASVSVVASAGTIPVSATGVRASEVIASVVVGPVVASGSAVVASASVVAAFTPSASGRAMCISHSGTVVEPHVAIGAVASVVRAMSEASAIGDIDAGASEVVVTVAIAIEDGVVPAISRPSYGTQEVVNCCEEPVLPVEEHVAQILVAVLPVVAECVGRIVYGQEIVEVYLVGTVVLLSCEVQLVCHLVRQEPSLLASRFVVEGFRREHCCECYN